MLERMYDTRRVISIFKVVNVISKLSSRRHWKRSSWKRYNVSSRRMTEHAGAGNTKRWPNATNVRRCVNVSMENIGFLRSTHKHMHIRTRKTCVWNILIDTATVLSATFHSLNDFLPCNVTLHIVWCRVTLTFDFIPSNGQSAFSRYVDRLEFCAYEYQRPHLYLRKNYGFKTINKHDVMSFPTVNGNNTIRRKLVWKNVFFSTIKIHFSNCFKRIAIKQYGVWVRLKS